MPIRPENRKLYPKDWKALTLALKEACGWKCQQCAAVHGQPHPITGSNVVLTVHHKDARPQNCTPANLIVLCQKCHLAADRERHARQRRKNRMAKKAVGSLFVEGIAKR